MPSIVRCTVSPDWNVKDPSACLGKVILLLHDLEVGIRYFFGIPRDVQGQAANGFCVDGEGAFVRELVTCILEICLGVLDLGQGHFEVLRSRLCLELLQHGQRGFRLGLLLFRRRPLHRVVDD